MTIRDLLSAILTLYRYRLMHWLGFRSISVSGSAADSLLRVAAQDHDQRIIVETLLKARRR
jgi:hypothetical protein